MISDLDPSCLRAFLAVVEEGGFTRAAVRLNRTQSAVSMQVRRLEEVLGTPLFANRKRVTLTAAGERLIGHARRIVTLNDEAVARARGTDIAGRVRFGTPDDYAASLLPAVLRRLASTHPRVEVEVHCDLSVNLVSAVDQGRLDLSLVTRPPGLEGGVTVRREPLLWVAASPGVAEQRPLPLALFSPGCLFRDVAAEALLDCGIPWRLAYQSPSLASLLAAVSEGLAVGVFARASVPSGLAILGLPHGFPALPDIDLAVYGARGARAPAIEAVRVSVIEALSTGALRAAA